MRRLALVIAASLWMSPAWATRACPPEADRQLSALIEQLDSPLSATDPLAYRSRIELLRDQRALLACPGPSPVPALFRTFLRSRYGSPDPAVAGALSPLPEDPDLFEGALQALLLQPPDRLVDGARDGLAGGLSALVWSRMRHDWVRPATAGLSAADRAWVEAWSPPEATEGASEELLALLADAPQPTLFSMTTAGGSLVHEVVAPLQDALLAAVLTEATGRPAVARALAGIAGDSGMAGPHTTEALGGLPALDPDTDAAVQRALAGLGSPPAWRPIQRPAVLPGHVPGLSLRDAPTRTPAEVVTRPVATFATPRFVWHGLAGALLLALGGVLGARVRRARPLAGVAVAVGLLGVGDGLAGLGGAPTGLDSLPLFSFIAQSEISPRPLPGHPDQQWLGGGSMRLSIVSPLRDGQRRVAVLGASTVHGSHYLEGEAFPARLQEALPDTQVLNLGIGGATSAGVASAGQTALQLGVDALVIAYGHNEAAQFTRLALYNHTSARRLTARLWLAESPLYTALARGLASPSPSAPPRDLYRSTSPSREEIGQLTQLAVRHTRFQLGRLIEQAQAAGVRVVLVIPPTNLRFAHLEPFASPGPGDAEDLDRLRREADEAVQAGDGERARALLQEAIDRSASPRELVTPIRDELLRLGSEYGLPIVDTQEWFCAFASDGLSPSGLFWDDVHPSERGHRELARVLAPVVAEELDR